MKLKSTRRYRRLLDSEGDDPLAGLANLFDIAMVLVVALLIALISRLPTDRATAQQAQAGQVPLEGQSLQQYQVGDSQSGGQGTRLGIAYQLESGKVIYVP